MRVTTKYLENLLVNVDNLLERKEITKGEYLIIGLLTKMYREQLEHERTTKI